MTKTERAAAGTDAVRPRRSAKTKTKAKTRSGRDALLALLLSTAAAPGLLPPLVSPAYAQGQLDFSIPAGDLGGVLAQIGRVGGRTISFPAEVTRGRVAGPINGRMSVEEAVARALSGSGLSAVPGAHGALTIRRVQTTAAVPAADENTLAAIDVADLVGSTGDRGFLSGNTGTSDRLNIPFKENPRSVTGVTQEVIRAQGVTSILDAARNASNVNVSYGAGLGQGIPSYNIRGFDVQNVMIGGRVGPRGINVPIQDVERVDVIKGPTTDLTGVSLAGGGINIIPKMPTAEPIRQAEVFLGSRFYRTLAFDLGGPVEGAEGLTYRLNVSGNTANTAPGGDRSPHEGLISPKVRWDNGVTAVTAGVRYFDQVSGLGSMTVGIPALNNRPIRVSRDRPIGTPDAGASFRAFNPYIDLEHKFGVFDTAEFGSFDFTVRNRTGYFANNYTSAGYIIQPSFRLPTIVTPIGHNISVTERQAVTQSDLIVVHSLGYYKQTARFGIDYTSDYNTYFTLTEYPKLSFDATTPPDTLALPNRIGLTGTPTRVRSRQNYDDIGLAFQDKIDLFDRVHILGTVRQDFYNTNSIRYASKTTTYRSDVGALTYGAGGVLDITSWMSGYGTIATGFVPNQGILAGGTPAPPRFSNLVEYGLKFNLFDDRFRVTVARFENDYSNTLVYDRALSGYKLGPGSSSSGLELEFQGQVTDNISLIGGIGRTLIRGQNARPGDVFPGIPPYTAKIFAVYSFTEGPLKGLQVGGGGEGIAPTYSGFGLKSETYKLPGYVIANAMVSYTRDNATVSLNVNNLLDRYYYVPTQTPFFIPVGRGREILAQARITF